MAQPTLRIVRGATTDVQAAPLSAPEPRHSSPSSRSVVAVSVPAMHESTQLATRWKVILTFGPLANVYYGVCPCAEPLVYWSGIDQARARGKGPRGKPRFQIHIPKVT